MTDEVVKPAPPALPLALRSRTLPLGMHRKALKVLHFGRYKTWKSYTLAHYPSPKMVIGGGGISPYLDPSSGDELVDAEDSPDAVLAAVAHALANERYFKSIVFDDTSNVWTYWMEGYAAKLGLDDIQAKDWRHIKGPLKKMQRQLDHSSLHVGFGAHLKDIEYGGEEPLPGQKAKLNIRQVVNPEIEKNFPYVLDLAFLHETILDSRSMPKPEHRLTFYFGRIPRNLLKVFRIGKSWQFTDSELKNPWDEIIAPLLPVWEEGATEHLGIDPDRAEIAVAEMLAAAEDQDLGAITLLINAPYPDIGAYRNAYEREIAPLYLAVKDPKRRALIEAAHDKRKKDFTQPVQG